MTEIVARIKDSKVILDGVKDFDTDHIFDNGQCFRWTKEGDGSYTGVAFGKVINVCCRNGQVVLNNTSMEDYQSIWKQYFDMDNDYGRIKELLIEEDSIMERAADYGWGMRILRQDPWETLISFIISQNNNIPRIKKCVESLCENHGERIGVYKGKNYFGFPPPETLAALPESAIDPCRLGYRARYILETAKKIAADGGAKLFRMPEASTEEAREYLLSLSGVGPKVANCILLFSMRKYESFPLDVWIKRVMNEQYHIKKEDVKAMDAYAKDHFKGYGGIAQQYLFYYARQFDKDL